ncbi:unnamed protein product [Choristocarpus tenellus]
MCLSKAALGVVVLSLVVGVLPMHPRTAGLILEARVSAHRLRTMPVERVVRNGKPTFPESLRESRPPKESEIMKSRKRPRTKSGGGKKSKGISKSQRLKIVQTIRHQQGRDAGRVSDLSEMLATGLPYLTQEEAKELQVALGVSQYAQSMTSHSRHGRDSHLHVKAGVEICLVLGKLEMSTDALLAAVLSGVLRPNAGTLGFGRARVTVGDIEDGFGPHVANLVESFERVTRLEEMAQTRLGGHAKGGHAKGTKDIHLQQLNAIDPSGDSVKGRWERDGTTEEQVEKLRDLILSEVSDWQVLTLCLAAHLQELQSALQSGGRGSAQLARDALHIHGPLAHRLGVHQLKNELEGLAFRRLYPQEFQHVLDQTQARAAVYREVLDCIKEAVALALNSNVSFKSQVDGDIMLQQRIKEPYSMWKKMSRQNVGVEGVYDAAALRVVFKTSRRGEEVEETYTARSEDMCYKAMSLAQEMLVHKGYPPVEGRYKDYVAHPKPNGYQSLHATHLVPDASNQDLLIPIELQVRSMKMHQQAEFGCAAHWSYKANEAEGFDEVDWMRDTQISSNSNLNNSGSQEHFVTNNKNTLDIPESVVSGRDFVNWLHHHLKQKKVFVFGPDKLIWELDKASATASHVLGELDIKGLQMDGVHDPKSGQGKRIACVNGREVPPHYPLKNGDVLDVLVGSS